MKLMKNNIFEKTLTIISDANVLYGAIAKHESGVKYDLSLFKVGDDQYRLRFLATKIGKWEISYAFEEIDIKEQLIVEDNESRGIIRVEEKHFYDQLGQVFIPYGTTAYAWIHQSEDIVNQTFESLKESPFNKIRMCIFPKSMPYNNNDPQYYPFKQVDKKFNYQEIDYNFWDMLDNKIIKLNEIGVEADVILFHPYDRWGFCEMNKEEVKAYLEYCVSRLSSHPNIWWSLANEYQLQTNISEQLFEEIGEFVHSNDPYHHLLSIHNIFGPFPAKPWMTHASVQTGDLASISSLLNEYKRPVIIDEFGYEGNIEFIWGNLTAKQFIDKAWTIVVRGAYFSHGETFFREDEVLWWSKGGKLYGEVPARIEFMKSILKLFNNNYQFSKFEKLVNPNISDEGLSSELIEMIPVENRSGLIDHLPQYIYNEQYYFEYLGNRNRTFYDLKIEENECVTVYLIDTYNMTKRLLGEEVTSNTRLHFSQAQCIGILIKYN